MQFVSQCNGPAGYVFITRAASVNYYGFGAVASDACHYLSSIFDPSIRSVNYHNVQHQSRECGFDAARRACHNLNSIIDPSIRSIVDPNVQHQSRKAALMLPGARDTTYILTSIPA